MRINANSHAPSRLCIWERDLYPHPPVSSSRPPTWQPTPDVPDDPLANVEGVLPNLANSLRYTAAPGRPDRVVYHGFPVDGATNSHCRPRGWLGKIYKERIQPVTLVVRCSVPVWKLSGLAWAPLPPFRPRIRLCSILRFKHTLFLSTVFCCQLTSVSCPHWGPAARPRPEHHVDPTSNMSVQQR